MTNPTPDLRTHMTRAIVGGFDTSASQIRPQEPVRINMDFKSEEIPVAQLMGHPAGFIHPDSPAPAFTEAAVINKNSQPPRHLNPAQAGVWLAMN